MSELLINTWIRQEKQNFEPFDPMVAERLEGGIHLGIPYTMAQQLRKNGEAKLVMPWGTYTAAVVSKGESGNITPAWEPSKAFLKLLNGDMDSDSANDVPINQEEFDPEFMKNFFEFVAYGVFNHKEDPDKDYVKGVRLTDEQGEYFLNSYAMLLATIARDKQRDGKVFRLKLSESDCSHPHGDFDFEYDEGEIKVTWTASKVFKQMLKDDATAANAAEV